MGIHFQIVTLENENLIPNKDGVVFVGCLLGKQQFNIWTLQGLKLPVAEGILFMFSLMAPYKRHLAREPADGTKPNNPLVC